MHCVSAISVVYACVLNIHKVTVQAVPSFPAQFLTVHSFSDACLLLLTLHLTHGVQLLLSCPGSLTLMTLGNGGVFHVFVIFFCIEFH